MDAEAMGCFSDYYFCLLIINHILRDRRRAGKFSAGKQKALQYSFMTVSGIPVAHGKGHLLLLPLGPDRVHGIPLHGSRKLP